MWVLSRSYVVLFVISSKERVWERSRGQLDVKSTRQSAPVSSVLYAAVLPHVAKELSRPVFSGVTRGPE